MIGATASSEDALRVYVLTIAYLHNAVIGNHNQVNATPVKKISPNIFHILHEALPGEQIESLAPLAVCTYDAGTQTWKVELWSGEHVTLLDRGKVWEVLEEAVKAPKRKVAKKPRRKRVTKP